MGDVSAEAREEIDRHAMAMAHRAIRLGHVPEPGQRVAAASMVQPMLGAETAVPHGFGIEFEYWFENEGDQGEGLYLSVGLTAVVIFESDAEFAAASAGIPEEDKTASHGHPRGTPPPVPRYFGPVGEA